MLVINYGSVPIRRQTVSSVTDSFRDFAPIADVYAFVIDELETAIGMLSVGKRQGRADKVAAFLDDIKNMGYRMAFQGGLSFNLDAVIIPEEKQKLVQEGYDRSDAIMEDYNMGLITNNERYNQIIDVWTNINSKLTKVVIDTLVKDDDGFNPYT